MKIENLKNLKASQKDIEDTLEAINLALDMFQQPLAVYDCSDAELARCTQQLKMMKVAYLLLQRSDATPPHLRGPVIQAYADTNGVAPTAGDIAFRKRVATY